MKVSPVPVERGFYVRLMSPLGRYPAQSLFSESAALIISPDVCFSIIKVLREDWSFSEVDSLKALEIPLYGSVLLSGQTGTPYLYPYPASNLVTLESEGAQSIEQCVSECRTLLLQNIQENADGSAVWHHPPALGGMKYDLVEEKDVEGDRLLILRGLEIANPIILRSVNCLLKARMAFQHSEFREAGCIFLWIALDAAHSLVLRKLRDNGIPNPTSADAARYFEKLSGLDTEWEKFFEDDYAKRIRAIHPDNRFDAEAIPQFLADDFAQLNDLLIPFFHYFVWEIATITKAGAERDATSQ